MEWSESISKAIAYIEDNITENLTMENIAKEAMISPFYFQKGFAMLCGVTVGEYIRCRRLALAGSELVSKDQKVIDIALRYGYDSPDSFTKAFIRFHGTTPTSVRKSGAMIKSFAPLKMKLILEGGYSMDYKLVEKEAFTVVGLSRTMKYENAAEDVPKLWKEVFKPGSALCGTYGINIDESMSGNEFEYLLADNYDPVMDVPEGFVTRVIPAYTWAVFACKGAMPQSIQEVNQKIFSEWLPGCNEYQIAAGYNIEMYSDPSEYAKGTQDENYNCQVWIPVRQKQGA